mgnify:CR=1 FL=1
MCKHFVFQKLRLLSNGSNQFSTTEIIFITFRLTCSHHDCFVSPSFLILSTNMLFCIGTNWLIIELMHKLILLRGSTLVLTYPHCLPGVDTFYTCVRRRTRTRQFVKYVLTTFFSSFFSVKALKKNLLSSMGEVCIKFLFRQRKEVHILQ